MPREEKRGEKRSRRAKENRPFVRPEKYACATINQKYRALKYILVPAQKAQKYGKGVCGEI